MDIVPRADLPGAHFGFDDVRSVFEDAAAGESSSVKVRFALIPASDMNDDQMLLMDGFSLQDAMSAFEVIYVSTVETIQPSVITFCQIGEPRLDSGYIPVGEVGQKFNPFVPLLPEELCWVIDRAFSYEVISQLYSRFLY